MSSTGGQMVADVLYKVDNGVPDRGGQTKDRLFYIWVWDSFEHSIYGL